MSPKEGLSDREPDLYYDEEDVLYNDPQDTVEVEPGSTEQGDDNLNQLANTRSTTVGDGKGKRNDKHATSDECVDQDKQHVRTHYTVREFYTTGNVILLGVCLDIGAQRTQAKSLCKELNTKLKIKPSQFSFVFGDGQHDSQDTIRIRITPPNDSFLQFDGDVVAADLPLLLGIDILDKEQLVADNMENILDSRKHGWNMNVTRRNRHMFLQ